MTTFRHLNHHNGGSLFFVVSGGLQHHQHYNQPDFLLPVHQVSLGGHVMVEFLLYFSWIVENCSCFYMNDRQCSPVSFSFSSGNWDTPLFIWLNQSGKQLWLKCICGLSSASRYLLRFAENAVQIESCQKLSKMLHFLARSLTFSLCVWLLVASSSRYTGGGLYRASARNSGLLVSNQVRFSRRRHH